VLFDFHCALILRRKVAWICLTILLALPYGAWATSYISIVAVDAGEEYSVRTAWIESEIPYIGTMGETSFTINVTESNPNDIDTCWIYMDASYTTGTSRTFTASDYRMVHGVVVIKYDNDTYEQKEFRIHPAWDPEATPSTGSTPPPVGPTSFPSDQTAAGYMSDVADGAPDGPTQLTEYCCCDSACSPAIATRNECAGTAPNCTGDLECP